MEGPVNEFTSWNFKTSMPYVAHMNHLHLHSFKMIKYSLWNVWNPIIESIEILAHLYWHAFVHSKAYFRGLLGKLGGL